jgi:hypothetical protein
MIKQYYTAIGLIDPATLTVVATIVSKIVNFGATQEFQQRQAYRDAGAEILSKLKALIPSLPEWLQQTVIDDREEFRQKMIRPHMNVVDYKAAIAWIQGREAAWQTMRPRNGALPVQASAFGIDQTTMLLIAAAGLAAYLVFKK